jgi:hypothetical protein
MMKVFDENGLAEGEGFEPPVPLRVRLISSQVPSTTQPPFLRRSEMVSPSRLASQMKLHNDPGGGAPGTPIQIQIGDTLELAVPRGGPGNAIALRKSNLALRPTLVRVLS